LAPFVADNKTTDYRLFTANRIALSAKHIYARMDDRRPTTDDGKKDF
jgi:hypothetical protein